MSKKDEKKLHEELITLSVEEIQVFYDHIELFRDKTIKEQLQIAKKLKKIKILR